MKFGLYTAILHDRSIEDALDVIASLGLDAAEINAGGFLPPVHLPLEQILTSQAARDDYLGLFADRGVQLAGLNANGRPAASKSGHRSAPRGGPAAGHPGRITAGTGPGCHHVGASRRRTRFNGAQLDCERMEFRIP